MFGAIIGILFLIYVITALVNVIGVVVGTVFSGAAIMPAVIFPGGEIMIGILTGAALYYWLKKKKRGKSGVRFMFEGFVQWMKWVVLFLIFLAFPAFLVVLSKLHSDLVPGLLIGIALYFLFFSRKTEQHEENC